MAYARFLSATVDWQGDTFLQNMETAFKNIQSNISLVLEVVGGDLVHDLQKHIQDDVYSKYQPIRYPRRKDHPQFGKALDNIANFTTKVNLNELEFDYSPDGTHKGRRKDIKGYDESATENADDPLKPYPVHGDVLINRIETGAGYDWKSNVTERPFWSKFVEEEMNGKLLAHFDGAARKITLTGDRSTLPYRYYSSSPADLIRTDADGELSTQATFVLIPKGAPAAR